ncbi:HNH endonuclease [Pedomonas sp. V897]|uniref:HNH endonuclease n=1 Tax=Pedomonas sp. V897 TaxID=3446482 RepID=UPI003EE227D3
MSQRLRCSSYQRSGERLRGRKGQEQRLRRLKAHGVTCARCERIGTWERRQATDALPLLVVDHIVPLALGGTDEDSNTRVVCEPCHVDVTAEQFGHRRRIGCDVDGWPIGDHPWNRWQE